MTEHRVLEIFSTILGTQAVDKGEMELDSKQFE